MKLRYIFSVLSILCITHVNGASKDMLWYRGSLTNNTFFALSVTVTYNGQGEKYLLPSNKTVSPLLLTVDATPKEQEVFNQAATNLSSISMPGNNLIIEMLAPPTLQQIKITNLQKKHYQVSTDKKGKLIVQ